MPNYEKRIPMRAQWQNDKFMLSTELLATRRTLPEKEKGGKRKGGGELGWASVVRSGGLEGDCAMPWRWVCPMWRIGRYELATWPPVSRPL